MTPTLKKKIRAAIASYCERAEKNEPAWHYTQKRPGDINDNPSADTIQADCSIYAGQDVWHYAMHLLKIYIACPLGYPYNGWGNTSTLEAWLRSHGKHVNVDGQPILVGDIARWGEGEHAHTAVCRKAGTRRTAIFSSHGREGGPVGVPLDYRGDLVGVWRHPALL